MPNTLSIRRCTNGFIIQTDASEDHVFVDATEMLTWIATAFGVAAIKAEESAPKRGRKPKEDAAGNALPASSTPDPASTSSPAIPTTAPKTEATAPSKAPTPGNEPATVVSSMPVASIPTGPIPMGSTTAKVPTTATATATKPVSADELRDLCRKVAKATSATRVKEILGCDKVGDLPEASYQAIAVALQTELDAVSKGRAA